jgi:hypothetical protein
MRENMFENIEACTTWNCVNSFALWISAIGMVAISSMTLWLTIKDKILRLSSIFDNGVLPGDDGKTMNRDVFILSFTNIGSRPVTVTNYRWIIRHSFFKKKYSFGFPHLDQTVGRFCTKFPSELTDGKEGHVFHNYTYFSDLEEPEKMLFANNWFAAIWRIYNFKLQIMTTVGKKFSVKIPFRVRRLIHKQYKKYKS